MKALNDPTTRPGQFLYSSRHLFIASFRSALGRGQFA